MVKLRKRGKYVQVPQGMASRTFGSKNNKIPLILLIIGVAWLAIDLGFIDIAKYNISIWPVIIIALALLLLGRKRR